LVPEAGANPGFGRDPAELLRWAAVLELFGLLPCHGGPGVPAVAAVAAAQSTRRGFVDSGRC